jgi:hypothetical protein
MHAIKSAVIGFFSICVRQRRERSARMAERTGIDFVSAPFTRVARRGCRAMPADVRRRSRARATRTRFAARSLPRRGELLEFAIHRAPRSLHRVESRRQPSERRDQPSHPHARPVRDGSIHIHFRIGDTNQSLCVHKAPPWGHPTGDPPLPEPALPRRGKRNCHALKLKCTLNI